MNPYVGRDSQILGVEEHRLVGGKGDGMRLLQVRNGRGLEFTVSLDRCADISRLSFRGVNCGFFSAAGYVAPAYYDEQGTGFLKSFTAGFLTTCGLTAAGAPCVDEGEELPMHGTVGNCPADHVLWDTDDEKIWIRATMEQNAIFGSKLTLRRTYTCPLNENRLLLEDRVRNEGDVDAPLMLLYHMNLGYPLLSPAAKVTTGSVCVKPRDARAAEDLETWNQVLEPQSRFAEQCYYHTFGDAAEGWAQMVNPEEKMGLRIRFDTDTLPFMTQWKMMGVRDYVMGLEPGNVTPDGRDVMRREGKLVILKPGEERTFKIAVDLLDEKEI